MISERLIQKREEAGLKQAELARRIGVGRDSYNRYERAGSQPSLEILARIATELNTTTDYLLGMDRLYEEALGASKKIEDKNGLSVKEPYPHSAENHPGMEKTSAAATFIQLDETEFSMITDFREMDAESKKDLLRMAKILAENSRLKKMLNK